MAKAVICIGSTHIENTRVIITYTASVMGPPNYSYSADYTVDITTSLPNNLLAWRNKIISQAQERSITLLPTDIIVFGGPS